MQVIPHLAKNYLTLRVEGQYSVGVSASRATLTTVDNPATHQSEKISASSQANHQTWATGFQVGYTLSGSVIDITPLVGISYRQWNRKPGIVDNPLVFTYDSRYRMLQSMVGVTLSARLNAGSQVFFTATGQLPISISESRSQYLTSDDFATIRQLYIASIFPKTPETIAGVDAVINSFRNGSDKIPLQNNLNWLLSGGVLVGRTKLTVSYEQLSLMPTTSFVSQSSALSSFKSRSVGLAVGYIF